MLRFPTFFNFFGKLQCYYVNWEKHERVLLPTRKSRTDQKSVHQTSLCSNVHNVKKYYNDHKNYHRNKNEIKYLVK